MTRPAAKDNRYADGAAGVDLRLASRRRGSQVARRAGSRGLGSEAPQHPSSHKLRRRLSSSKAIARANDDEPRKASGAEARSIGMRCGSRGRCGALELRLANVRQWRHRWPGRSLVGRDGYRRSCRHGSIRIGRCNGQFQWRRWRLDWRLVRQWQRRLDRRDRRPVYRCRRRVDRRERRLVQRRQWRQWRIDWGSRRLRCGRIDGLRRIDRYRGFGRWFRWPGRVWRFGDVWKGRSIWNGRQRRKRQRR